MNKCNTILGQLLALIPRPEFEKLVKSENAEKYNKGFTAWMHFGSMIFAQLTSQHGLRSIESSLAQNSGAAYHLNFSREIKRSTLSHANNTRSSEFFEKLFYLLLSKMERKGTHGFKFKNPLYSIDATTIDLCLNLFPWADFRTKKAGVKVSVKLDHRGKIPVFAIIENARKHESKTVEDIPLETGDIVAFDRGYNNYSYFASLCNRKIYFVTRLKSNAIYTVVSTNEDLPENIISDETIELSSKSSKKDCPHLLRKIVSFDPKTKKKITILTNMLTFESETVAAIYKDRWQIELFFKAIKQNLKIKRFYGTSKNAVHSQIWIALIAYLLYAMISILADSKKGFTHFMSELPPVLFQRRLILHWLKPPPKQTSPPSKQLELF